VKAVVLAVTLSAQVNGSGRNAAVGAGSILLSDASLDLETGSLPAFSSGLISAGVTDITVLYRTIVKNLSESLNNYAGQVIQFREVVLPTPSRWVLCFSSGSAKKYIDFDCIKMQRFTCFCPLERHLRCHSVIKVSFRIS
jgi:hypothetical protein